MPKLQISKEKFRSQKCIVRLYVIRATDLTPKDFNGKVDSYVTAELGDEKHSTRDRCIKNELNPFYGELLQFEANIPCVKDLRIKVKDYDRLDRNDLVGETVIDLEDRYLWNKLRGVVIPQTYYK